MPAKLKPATLRTSERKTFERCPQRWWWSYREGLVSNKPPSNPLWFGTGIHLALAEWYIPGFKRGKDPVQTWLEWSEGEVRKHRENWGEPNPEYIDMRELGAVILEEYKKEYGEDRQWEILAPEYSAQVLVQRLYDGGTVTYGFTLDGVLRDHSDRKPRLKILETKTAASISVRHLSLEPQKISYVAFGTEGLRAAGLIPEEEELNEVIYNFLRKSKPKDNPVLNADGMVTNKPTKAHYFEQFRAVDAMYDDFRELTGKESLAKLQEIAERNKFQVFGEVAKNQPPKRFLRQTEEVTPGQINRHIEQIENEILVMDKIRAGELPLWKNIVADGPMACTGCPFFEMCELHDMDGDWEEYRDLAFHREDPYADHKHQKSA